MSAAHKRRLGIPDGHVRIYGVLVPQDRSEPLRSYASEMARRRGYDAAKQFVVANAGRDPVRPFPPLQRALGPYLPPKEFARLRLLHRTVRGFHIFVRRIEGTWRKRSGGTQGHARIDWDLAATLLAEGATEAEVVALFGASKAAFRHKAISLGLVHPKRRMRRDR